MALPNWIEGRNPYKLVEPSAWWLQLLRDYDDQLVLIPSVKDHCYRLTRRASHEARLGTRQMATVHTHPDTVQFAAHGLLPVATVNTWAIKSDKIIRDLMARDFNRHGGAAKVLSETEYNEELAERKKAREQSQQLDHVNNEAYRSLQFRKGSAVSMRTKAETRHPSDKTVSSHRSVGPRAQPASFAPKVVLVTSPD